MYNIHAQYMRHSEKKAFPGSSSNFMIQAYLKLHEYKKENIKKNFKKLLEEYKIK